MLTHPGLHLQSIMMLKIYTIESHSKVLVVVGYVGFPMFLLKESGLQPTRSSFFVFLEEKKNGEHFSFLNESP